MEGKILDLFTFNDKLRFNEIEKKLGERSNKLDYHLKKLVEKGILLKNGSNYYLSESAEYLIPYLSSKKAVLPVILIHIGDGKSAFLIKREKRPYKGMLSLPGGRMVIGENISNAVKRIMKEKFGISIRLKEVNSVSLEHVKKKGKILHSFLLIFVSATAQGLKLIDIENNKKEIIPSDLWLIKNCKGKKTEIDVIYSRENK